MYRNSLLFALLFVIAACDSGTTPDSISMADPGYGQFVINNETTVRTSYVTITTDTDDYISSPPTSTNVSLATEDYILHFGFDALWDSVSDGDALLIEWMTLEKQNGWQYYFNYSNGRAPEYFTVVRLDRTARTLSGTFQGSELSALTFFPKSSDNHDISFGSFTDIPYDHEPVAWRRGAVTILEKPDFITPSFAYENFSGTLDLRKHLLRLQYQSDAGSSGLELMIKARPADIFSNLRGKYILEDTTSLNSAIGSFDKFENKQDHIWNFVTSGKTGGTLEITHHDVAHQRISGNFRFKATVDSTNAPLELECTFDSVKLGYSFWPYL